MGRRRDCTVHERRPTPLLAAVLGNDGVLGTGPMFTLVYATRKSMLALAQSRAFVGTLVAANPGLATDELQVVTTGDRIQDRPLSEVGGKGLFVKEIEEAMLEGRADVAVHSIKDVPAELPEGLAILGIPRREDARDALISPKYGTLEAIPQGGRVGTSSLRRSVLLRRARPDLEIVPLRGNVDTRLRRVENGDFDGILLAAAGLHRLDLQARIDAYLDPKVFIPAVGQGALGIEAVLPGHAHVVVSEEVSVSAERPAAIAAILAKVHHADTARAVAAERGVMKALGGDCKTPLGAYAVREGNNMILQAFFAEPDGANFREKTLRVSWPTSDDDARGHGLAVGAELLG